MNDISVVKIHCRTHSGNVNVVFYETFLLGGLYRRIYGRNFNVKAMR